MTPLGSGDGSPSSTIMIVGEAWGEEEERHGRPFVGRSGIELSSMLNEAGIMRSDCYVTNVINARPPNNNLSVWVPDKKKDVTSDMILLRGRWVKPIVAEGWKSLQKEIDLVKPKLILALGGTALWALCGRQGIVKWRGSLLDYEGTRVVPTYHPAAVLRMWEWRAIAVHDLARGAREMQRRTERPAWTFQIRPSFEGACRTLQSLYSRALLGETPLWLDFDIETSGGHIRCYAISWGHEEAISIPLMGWDGKGWTGSYWTEEEEAYLLWLTYKLFTHRAVALRGQNLLYDFQYVYRHWHYIPNLGQDTMLTHHVLWAGMPKSLLFQASMYCEYFANWKDMVRHNEEKEGA